MYSIKPWAVYKRDQKKKKKSSCLCQSQIMWAEQEADFDTFKYTKESFGEKEK